MRNRDYKGNEWLEEERKQATFDIESLSILLDEGKDCHEFKQRFMELMERDPVFQHVDKYDQSLDENRKQSLEKALRVNELYRLLLPKQTENEALYYKYRRHAWRLLALSDPSFATKYGVHDMLFKGAILSQAHSELQAEYLPLIETYKVYGCFAMTELGHGSNLRGIETTATFNQSTDEFIIHSPSKMATKWWIGGAGQTATHAVVFAQLIIGERSYGPHFFLVQLRDLHTQMPLPGISIGDIGKKMGRDGVDNGFIMFTQVRIPRNHMLMKWAKVSSDGKYSKPPLPQLSYIPILNGRIEVTSQSGYDLQRAATIAVRYACIRRQFKPEHSKNEQEKELKIMDYQTHQYRVLPWLATAYAIHFTSLRTLYMYERVSHDLNNGRVTATFNDLHSITAGLKAASTWLAYKGIDSCRTSLAGHGYSQYSGLPQLYQDFAVMVTWEGENFVMALQTSRYLIKAYQRLLKKSGQLPQDSTISYLNNASSLLQSFCKATQISDFLDTDTQVHAFRYKATRLIHQTSMRLQHEIQVNKKTSDEAWNACLVDLISCSQAHCHLYMLESFIQVIESINNNESLKQVLKYVCDLFALYLLDQEDKTSLLTSHPLSNKPYLSEKQAEMLSEQLRKTMLIVRKEAVALVDAFNLSDYIINSPFGRYDGMIYDHYFNRVLQSPINQLLKSRL
jgi:acyl-CoA oxidase